MDTSDELIHDFIEEANDLLDSLDLGIVEMEKNPQDAALLGRVFGRCTPSKAAVASSV